MVKLIQQNHNFLMINNCVALWCRGSNDFEIYMSSKFHESNTMEYGQQIYKNKTTSVIILNNNRICSLVV